RREPATDGGRVAAARAIDGSGVMLGGDAGGDQGGLVVGVVGLRLAHTGAVLSDHGSSQVEQVEVQVVGVALPLVAGDGLAQQRPGSALAVVVLVLLDQVRVDEGLRSGGIVGGGGVAVGIAARIVGPLDLAGLAVGPSGGDGRGEGTGQGSGDRDQVLSVDR